MPKKVVVRIFSEAFPPAGAAREGRAGKLFAPTRETFGFMGAAQTIRLGPMLPLL